MKHHYGTILLILFICIQQPPPADIPADIPARIGPHLGLLITDWVRGYLKQQFETQ